MLLLEQIASNQSTINVSCASRMKQGRDFKWNNMNACSILNSILMVKRTSQRMCVKFILVD